MAKFLNLFNSIGAKKYAPPPPEIDYKPSEIYRVDPVTSPREDDLASVASEYCDPEDIRRTFSKSDCDSEYSVPCDGPDSDVYYSAVAEGVCSSDGKAASSGNAYGVDSAFTFSPVQMSKQWSEDARSRVPSWPADVYGSPSTVSGQGQLVSPQGLGEGSGSCAVGSNNEDYDCPWDTGAVETEVYQMVKEREVRAKSEVGESDAPAFKAAAVLSKSSSASQPSLYAGADDVYSSARNQYTSKAQTPVVDKSSPAFTNKAYNIADDDNENTNAVTSTSGAMRSSVKKPTAVPRERNKHLHNYYVNRQPPVLFPPQAPPPPSPASIGAAQSAVPSEADSAAGTYDVPWDMRKLEESLAAKETKLSWCGSVTAAGLSPCSQMTDATDTRGHLGPATSAGTNHGCGLNAAQQKSTPVANANCSKPCKPPMSLQLPLNASDQSASGMASTSIPVTGLAPAVTPAVRRPGPPWRLPMPKPAGPVSSSGTPGDAVLDKSSIGTASKTDAKGTGQKFGSASPACFMEVVTKELCQVLGNKSQGLPVEAPDKKVEMTAIARNPAKVDMGSRAAAVPPADTRGQSAARAGANSPTVGSKTFSGGSNANPLNKGAVSPPVAAEKKGSVVPLENQRWYHGDIARQRAEELLINEPVGSFLIRVSSSNKQDYSLSLRVPTLGAIHLKITVLDGSYVLGQFSQPFHSIPEMVEYYSSNVINIRCAEHLVLSNPIMRS